MIIPFSIKHYRYLFIASFLVAFIPSFTYGDILTLEPQEIHQQSAVCEEGRCAKFDVITLRVAKVGDDELIEKINEHIQKRVIDVNQPVEMNSLSERGREFISSFEDSIKDGEADLDWHISGAMKEVFRNPAVLCLQYNEEGYTGGAHGYSKTILIPINLQTGEEFTLESLFSIHREELFPIAEKEFRKRKGLQEKASLADAGYFYPTGTFALSQEWGITDEGIMLFYNEYEAAPYSEGTFEVLLNKKEVSSLLDKKWIGIFQES